MGRLVDPPSLRTFPVSSRLPFTVLLAPVLSRLVQSRPAHHIPQPLPITANPIPRQSRFPGQPSHPLVYFHFKPSTMHPSTGMSPPKRTTPLVSLSALPPSPSPTNSN
ncbi:hypothetical protein BO70DRAFT_113338 [Aspergillus heteromorphus CBS 117.55]|uniref:Uncharacterized protein n=1 Tax=Aspergillus heteromorphus CBS 117.55 TaxID=1448321 RepID=A0A317VEZ4_9EURO|nr:uncharacterized protein BO70DRAFT_113338 [Aspergillus heteromorphus CBS 117.55]PWY72943.1 hypothetical protein BO70DRAFT_113338 [Aspergillus heteromorphus CBS 117.55]